MLKNYKKELDKYYTPTHIAKECINTFKKLFPDVENFLEPSAGNGSFSNQIKNCDAYDILPEGKNIKQANFLCVKIPYEYNRCVIGNPPFGKSNNMANYFINKASMLGDYVAFILPPSFIYSVPPKNFVMVYHKELDNKIFGFKISTAFIIYRRGKTTQQKINCVEVFNINRRKKLDKNISMIDKNCIGFRAFGKPIGKISDYVGQYVGEVYIKSSDKKLLDKAKKIDWSKYKNYRRITKNIVLHEIEKIVNA